MSYSRTADVITSRTNPRVKQLRAAFKAQARLSAGLVAIEGDNLVKEALRSGIALETVFVSDDRSLPSFLPSHVEVLQLSGEVFASVVETRSPQGLAALIVPRVHPLEAVIAGTALVLVAAGLQDPGNLGTLIRSAEAFGATGVLTTEGTVSPWNGKALRASAGSVFRVPVVSATHADLLMMKKRGVSIIAAIPEGSRSVALQNASLSGPLAILIGNEGSGLGDDLLRLADLRVTISCPGSVESLNAAVAGSLFLYEAARQRAAAGSNR